MIKWKSDKIVSFYGLLIIRACKACGWTWSSLLPYYGLLFTAKANTQVNNNILIFYCLIPDFLCKHLASYWMFGCLIEITKAKNAQAFSFNPISLFLLKAYQMLKCSWLFNSLNSSVGLHMLPASWKSSPDLLTIHTMELAAFVILLVLWSKPHYLKSLYFILIILWLPATIKPPTYVYS